MWPIPALTARKKTALLLIVLGGLALTAWLYWSKKPDTYTSEPGPVEQGLEIKWAEPKIEIPPPKVIKTYDKVKLSRELKMPELTTFPPVISVATVKPHTGPTTVVSTLTPEGEGRVYLRREPPKFFELKREFRVEGKYLFAGDHTVEADLVANPLRIGPVEVEAGVGVEVRRSDSRIGARGWIGFQYRF